MITKCFCRTCLLSIIGATENLRARSITSEPSFTLDTMPLAKFDDPVTLLDISIEAERDRSAENRRRAPARLA
jgi:hypothetical protein